MNFHPQSQQQNYYKGMSLDQFNQVVEAISEGHYSWACVLILRFAGYNPVHFIPYRTYSRLLKDNTPPVAGIPQRPQPTTKTIPKNEHQIQDLEVVEVMRVYS